MTIRRLERCESCGKPATVEAQDSWWCAECDVLARALEGVEKTARYKITDVTGFMAGHPQAGIGGVWVDTYDGDVRTWMFERRGAFSHVTAEFIGWIASPEGIPE